MNRKINPRKLEKKIQKIQKKRIQNLNKNYNKIVQKKYYKKS